MKKVILSLFIISILIIIIPNVNSSFPIVYLSNVTTDDSSSFFPIVYLSNETDILDTNASTECAGASVLLGNSTCYPIGYFAGGSPDTNESSYVSNLSSEDCSGTNKITGVLSNGTIVCEADAGGTVNMFNVAFLNESLLNNTIDLRSLNLSGTNANQNINLGIYNFTANWFKGKFNWTSSDTWNIFDGSTLTFNDTKLLGDVWFFVVNFTASGTAKGTLENTQQYDDYDGISFNLTEAVPNGLEYYANTSADVTTDVNKICIRYLADGDDFDVSIWDIPLNDWEGYITLTSNTDFAWVCTDIRDSADHLVDDKIMIKIVNAYQDSTQHKLFIDAMYVSSGYTPRIGNEVDPVSIHANGNTPLTGEWNVQNNITNISYLQSNIGNFSTLYVGDANISGVLQDFNSNAYAKYQFTNNNFNGSGNWSGSSIEVDHISEKTAGHGVVFDDIVYSNDYFLYDGSNVNGVITGVSNELIFGVPGWLNGPGGIVLTQQLGDWRLVMGDGSAGAETTFYKLRGIKPTDLGDETYKFRNLYFSGNATIDGDYCHGSICFNLTEKNESWSSTQNDTYDAHITATGADHSYINQAVTTTSSPTFNSPTVNSMTFLNTYPIKTVWRAEYLLGFQQQTDDYQMGVEYWTKKGDGGDNLNFDIWAYGIPTDLTPYELMQFGYIAGATPYFKLSSTTSGGTVHPLKLYTGANLDQLTLNADGTVVMATAVNDAVANLRATYWNSATGQIGYDSSSARYKENIVNMTDEISNKIYDLRPVTYDKINGADNLIGLTAEEVNDLFPQCVFYKRIEIMGTCIDDINGNEYECTKSYELEINKTTGKKIPEGINYECLISPLVKSIQDLKTENDLIKNCITNSLDFKEMQECVK